MWDILAAGSLYFWMVFGVEALILLTLLAYEEFASATVSLIIALLLYQFLGTPIFTYIAHNPQAVAVWGALYMGVGTIWAVAKWWVYVREQRAEYNKLRVTYLKNLGLDATDPIPLQKRSDWAWTLQRNNVKARPQVSDDDNKSRICAWIAYWPWSAAWFLLNEPIVRFSKFVYHGIGNCLQKISDDAFRGTENDL